MSDPDLFEQANAAIIDALDAMNVSGWLTGTNPATGEPTQVAVPLDYIAESILMELKSQMELAVEFDTDDPVHFDHMRLSTPWTNAT